MKIAYLIQAHKNPRLIKSLVDQLSCDQCGFHVHIDEKSDIKPFSIIQGDNVFFCEHRVKVYWAEYTQVEATLTLMRSALKHKYDYLILLSGSDYPLRSKRYIHEFFEKHKGTEFIGMVKIPSKEAGIPLSRITNLRYPSTSPVRNKVFRALTKIGLAQRDYKKALGLDEVYGGSTWWALAAGACEYILETAATNTALCKYFQKTSASDEMFFHTILGNSSFKQRIRRNVMYDDWINIPSHSPHPAALTDEHVSYFERNGPVACNDAFGPGEMLFARKFSDENLELLKRMDQMISAKDAKQYA